MAQRPGWPLARVAILLAVGAAALPFLETTAPDAECAPDPFARVPAADVGAVGDAAAILADETDWTLSEKDAARFERAADATFGFATADGAAAVLGRAGAGARRLVDLGSGNGHAILYAALLNGNLTCAGVELAAGRAAASARALARLDALHPDRGLAARVAFVAGDMLAFDVSSADVAWASTGAGKKGDLLRYLHLSSV